MLYSVMLLDATEKSFFCNPACYARYNNNRPLLMPGGLMHDILRKMQMRAAWQQRSAAVKLALTGSPLL